ncbi:MAG: glycosyltransferase [Bacteroidales bacterium]|nr:glycosyltransferase [Bacteroidales bacterium]
MKKIFYFMHVDWNWIKQRPHFLSEGLSKYFDIEVRYERNFIHNKRLTYNQKKETEHLKIRSIKRLPFNRFYIIYILNSIISKMFLWRSTRNADFIWVPSPLYFPYYKKRKNQIVVYDCMDNMLGFNQKKSLKRRIEKYEKRLVKQADIIISTSEYLRDILVNRYNLKKNIHVINNAIFTDDSSSELVLPQSIQICFENNTFFKIVYIGTIAEWFDFDLLISSVKQNEKIKYFLFGPCEIDIPKHPQIEIVGPIEHKYIYPVMQQADCLIMPFIINELIRSVNPVKAYEYIYAHKPVIMPHYGESEKFADYIYLYDTPQKYHAFITKLVNQYLTPKNSYEAHKKYALQNTWDCRIAEIRKILVNNNS